jgi:hypothetical protein
MMQDNTVSHHVAVTIHPFRGARIDVCQLLTRQMKLLKVRTPGLA